MIKSSSVLDEKNVVIRILVKKSEAHLPRDQRPTLVTVAPAGVVPKMASCKFDKVLEVIDDLWAQFTESSVTIGSETEAPVAGDSIATAKAEPAPNKPTPRSPKASLYDDEFF